METKRPAYPTVLTILAWGVLYGPEGGRDGCADDLARRILGEETSPDERGRPTAYILSLLPND
jgi:hypothetical protein